MSAATAMPAHAVTIDLESPSSFAGATYSKDGFTLTNSVNNDYAYGDWLKLGYPEFNANGANGTLFQNFSDTTNTLTRDGGGTFGFQGISLADVYNDGTGGNVSFVFNYLDGGSSTQTVTLGAVKGLQAFDFNQSKLTSLGFTATSTEGRWLQFDFLKVTPEIAGAIGAGAVPEPAMWAMMIGGTGMIGGALRRRSRARTAPRFA